MNRTETYMVVGNEMQTNYTEYTPQCHLNAYHTKWEKKWLLQLLSIESQLVEEKALFVCRQNAKKNARNNANIENEYFMNMPWVLVFKNGEKFGKYTWN